MKNRKQPAPETAKEQQSPNDPLGSWTGVPSDPYEIPEQDADDL